MNPHEFGQPGEVDMVINTSLYNSHPSMPLTIISGEYSSINKITLQPGQRMSLNLKVPAGFREYINETSYGDTNYLYIGLRDKDAAEPMVHEPNF